MEDGSHRRPMLHSLNPGCPVGATASGLGALAPDIDHAHSTIGNRVPAVLLTFGTLLLVSRVALRAASAGGMFAPMFSAAWRSTGFVTGLGALLFGVGAVLLYLSIKVTKSVQHRGPVHSLSIAAASTVVALPVLALLGLEPWYGFLFGFGWFTHLMADATTKTGLPSLFWPFVSPAPAGGSRMAWLLVLPLLLFGLTGWCYVAPAVLSSSSAAPPVAASAPRAAPVVPNVVLARQRLREAAPEIADAVTNPDSPQVESRGEYTSYTWEYLRKSAPNQAAVKSIELTLDGSGQIAGVDGR